MKINLKQLEAFVWVADLHSFRGAAERLHTTQPNISSRISRLEAALGVTLMTRDAGSVTLTPKGEDLLLRARTVLRSAEAFLQAADKTDLSEGVLKLGATEIIVHSWLRDFLRRLKARFPDVVVELTIDLAANLEGELAKRALDLSLQNGPFAHKASGRAGLGSYPMVWVASPALGLRPAQRQTMQQLSQFPILTHARDSAPFAEIANRFRSLRNAARLVPSSNLAACLQMTLDGMGLAALPRAMVDVHLASGDLVEIQSDWTPKSLGFEARYDAQTAPAFVAEAASLAADCARAYGDQHATPQAPMPA